MDKLHTIYWFLLILPTVFAVNLDDMCDKWTCNTTVPTSTTKTTSDRRELCLDDASDPSDIWHLYQPSQLYCCFVASPYCPNIQWFKDGTELFSVEGKRKIKYGGRVLDTFSAKTADSGVYSCNATTPYGEKKSHVITLTVQRVCDDEIHVEGNPSGNVIHVPIGTSQTLQCSFFCYGENSLNSIVWRNGTSALINVNETQKYQMSNVIRNQEGSKPFAVASLTVLNFRKSDNITCFTIGKFTGNHTFHLVPISCDEPPWFSPIPSGIENIYVKKRSNITLTCQIFCLEKEDFVAEELRKELSFFKRMGQWILTGCLLGIVVILVFTLMWFRRRIKTWSIFYRPNINKPEIEAKYDAFISFSEDDGGSFVRSTLVPMLEEECGYALSLHYREFVPGTTIVDNITDFIDDSRRIITIVTPSFLKSEWCRFEVDQGLRRAVERPNTLVVVMLSEIPRVDMPKSLQHFINKVTFLVWNDGQPNKMREKLIRALGKPLTSYEGKFEGNQEELFVTDNVAASTNETSGHENGTFLKDIV